MNECSRTYNSITNSIFGIIASLITVIINFAVRIVLVYALGEEINGLHNLFQSITNVMALMEMGISSAMIIHLYEPVKNQDEDSIKAIMSFYKKVYILIAIIFTILCMIVDFGLLNMIVTTTINMGKVRLYFALFTLSFSLNYFTYHKRSLLFAEQKNRISIGVTAICEIIFRTLEILSVLVFHQYIIFLILMICEKFSSNAICAYYVNKHHPYLKSYKGVSLGEEKRRAIFNTVKPLFVNQMAATVQKASNSILVSILLGNVSTVGYFGNYQLVTSTAELLFSQFGGAFTTSFGNLAVDKNKDRMYHAYLKSAFLMNSVAGIICAGFIACIQDFIYIVFGTRFMLSIMSVIFLTMNLMVCLLNIPIISIQNAMGLHGKDDKIMIVQAVCAICLGYLFGKRFGMSGIFVGLLIPLVIFTLIVKGIIIYRAVFRIDKTIYIKYIVKELMRLFLTVIVSLMIGLCLPLQGTVWAFLLKGLLSLCLSIILLVIVSRNDNLFKENISSIMNYIRRRV